MSAWSLPTTATVDGKETPIRSDFRAVVDALAALDDLDLTMPERAAACVRILYPEWKDIQDWDGAFKAAMEFINLGEPTPENQPPKPKLVDWTKDAGLIAPAIDAVLGYSCRRCDYLHWWEFIGAYSSIGRGLFATVVGIRSKRIKGQKLEKYEQEFVRDNPDLISIAPTLPSEEQAFFDRLGV